MCRLSPRNNERIGDEFLLSASYERGYASVLWGIGNFFRGVVFEVYM
jgi:hypothetical protein